MGRALQSGENAIPGKSYRIMSLDPDDNDPTLKVGDIVECAHETRGCVDPVNHAGDGFGVEWLADFLGDGFGTLVTGLEEVEPS